VCEELSVVDVVLHVSTWDPVTAGVDVTEEAVSPFESEAVAAGEPESLGMAVLECVTIAGEELVTPPVTLLDGKADDLKVPSATVVGGGLVESDVGVALLGGIEVSFEGQVSDAVIDESLVVGAASEDEEVTDGPVCSVEIDAVETLHAEVGVAAVVASVGGTPVSLMVIGGLTVTGAVVNSEGDESLPPPGVKSFVLIAGSPEYCQ